MATETVAKPRTSVRVGVQKFGTFLSGMIMPNIGAFIAWGLITALFIEKGWFPVAELGGFGTNAEGLIYEHTATLNGIMPESGVPAAGSPLK